MKIGGKIIDSGGYGCVFRPSLNCKNNQNNKTRKTKLLKKSNDTISKLMTIKHAEEEYEHIKYVKQQLSVIKNYEEYFNLSPIELCKPTRFDSEDLEMFQKKCKPLYKEFDTENMNNHLDDLRVLNMPYGGININRFFKEKVSYRDMIKFNQKMIVLLNNGIIPMNRANLFHNDIKGSNILINKSSNSFDLKIIDWGLLIIYDKRKIPSKWKRGGFAFNSPFEFILFSDLFEDSYTSFLNNKKGQSLKSFVYSFILKWLNKYGDKHLGTIQFIYKSIIDEHAFSRENTIQLIANHIVFILENYSYSKNNIQTFIQDYFDKVFIHNVDLWGFIMSYISLYELFYDNYDNLDNQEYIIYSSLQNLFIKYLYTPQVNPMNINEINKDLAEITKLLKLKI